MKKFLVVFVVFVFIPFLNVYGQMAVIDSMANEILNRTGLAQAVYYAQMVEDNITSIDNLVKTVENGKKQIEMAAKNLKTITDVKSWDDFMSWYNRQLYLERMTMETWDNMNVTIGKKDYHISDIAGMQDGLNETYVEYWNNEFTEEQIKEMWLNMGLTPANYAYVAPFRAKAKDLMKEGLTAVDIQNDWYKRNMEKNNERQRKLAEDKNKPEEKQLGSKELMMMILETLLETNKTTNDMAMNQAKDREERAVNAALENAPDNTVKPGAYISDGFEKF